MTTQEIASQVSELVHEYGLEVSNGVITTLGSFENESVEILYFHNAMMNGDTGDEYGDDWSAYLTTETERECFGVDILEPFAILSWTNKGFYGLEYVGREELEEMLEERDSVEYNED